MLKRPILFAIILLTASACSLPISAATPETDEATSQTPVEIQPSTGDPEGDKPCGDGVCQGPENPTNCPQDCETTSEQASTLPDDDGVFWVQNPTSSAMLYALLLTPGDWDGTPLPALVLVPGGFGNSTDFLGERRSAQDIADQGFTIVIFDPDGRGNSEGQEDKNGHTQQDGLAEVILTTAGLPEVDASRIGLVSYSYGVTMASGALARYPHLPVLFYIDWEGPANREYTTHDCSPDAPGIGSTQGMAPCDDEAFWSEREAETFIAQIQVPYLRLQFENDHAQDVVTHAIDMVNAAVNGTAPWVQLNDQTPNQTYDPLSPPPMFPGSTGGKLDRLVSEFAQELLTLFAP